MRGSVFRFGLPMLAAMASISGCDSPVQPIAPEPGAPARSLANVTLRLDTLESGLSSPVYVTWAPGDLYRLYIVEKTGRIRIRGSSGMLADPFLDLMGQVSGLNEQGLLGLAFHPRYASNRRLFVNYTDLNGDTRIVEYRRAGPNRVDPASARQILFVNQPAANHNGGMMAFGADGYLYIALGDGGGGHRANGQRMNTLLGKVLRIDVDGALPYGIPTDNPFVGLDSIRPEIWHTGLRNPWRFSFDRGNGRMFIADVGQNTYEEVNVVPAGTGGLNFGWGIMEGPACFDATTCDQTGLRLPTFHYTHAEGCSITGGYVYRGAAMPDLRGQYFFADFCSGVIRSIRVWNGNVRLHDWSDQLGLVRNVTSFGEGRNGALYVTTINGRLMRIAPAE